jgi:hypothetical protein
MRKIIKKILYLLDLKIWGLKRCSFDLFLESFVAKSDIHTFKIDTTIKIIPLANSGILPMILLNLLKSIPLLVNNNTTQL